MAVGSGSTYDRVAVSNSLTIGTRTNGTVNGTAVDTAAKGGMKSIGVWVQTGTLTDGVHTFSVQESADGSTGWATIADPGGGQAPRIHGTATVTAAANDDTIFNFGVTTSLRYVRLVCVTSGATSGGTVCGGFYADGNRSGDAR